MATESPASSDFYPATRDELAWREDLLHAILRFLAPVAALVYAVSIFKVMELEAWIVVAVDTVSVAMFVVLWRWRSLPYRIRAVALCLTVFALGATLLSVATWLGQLYLLALSVMVTALLGARPGLISATVNALAIWLAGAVGWSTWVDAHTGNVATPGDWFAFAANFFMMAALLVLLVSAMLRRIERALAREIASGQALTRERALLHARERHLQALVDVTPEGVLVLDPQGRIMEVNRVGLDMLQAAEPGFVLGQPMVRFIPEADRVRFRVAHDAVCRGESRSMACDLVGWDGGVVGVEWASAALPSDDKGTLHLALLRDVTVRRRLEEQLREPQRLDALGKLTGGMAHDFNNLLTVVQGNAETLTERLAGDAELKDLAQGIQGAAVRGADLIRALLAFAGRQPLSPRSTDLRTLLERTQVLLRRTLGEHVHLQVQLPDGPAHALVDPPQLEAAVINLCLNARDAMPHGGRIVIDVNEVTVDKRHAEVFRDLLPGVYWRLTVADNGCGMNDEVRTKAVDPFFTTKGVGRGTGLGLSMVYGFVRQSRGAMLIESTPDVGTQVILYLPTAPTAPLVGPSEAHDQPMPGGSERILVVEDEHIVRDYLVRQLQGLGYQIVSVSTAAHALDLLRGGARFELLFTDVMLPGGMNGRQLGRAVRALHPGLRLLYTTGYAEGYFGEADWEEYDAPLLRKPYARIELAHKVREVLDRAPASAPGPAHQP